MWLLKILPLETQMGLRTFIFVWSSIKVQSVIFAWCIARNRLKCDPTKFLLKLRLFWSIKEIKKQNPPTSKLWTRKSFTHSHRSYRPSDQVGFWNLLQAQSHFSCCVWMLFLLYLCFYSPSVQHQHIRLIGAPSGPRLSILPSGLMRHKYLQCSFSTSLNLYGFSSSRTQKSRANIRAGG